MPDIKGVDLASFQGEPGQWTKLPGAQGIQWAAVKFTEVSPQFGVYENPDAKDDWDYLLAHKLGRVAYLFAHPSISIDATIGPFAAMVEQLGLLPGDGIAVDLEVTDGLSPAAVAAWAQELFANLVRLFGRRPLVYTFVNFIETGNCHGLDAYPLWIASLTTPGLPQVPHPFTNWFAQQYAQAGPIDQDVAHFSSLAAMQAAMGKPQFHTVEAVWVTAGMDGLVDLSHLLKTEIPVILERTLSASANHVFAPNLHDYLAVGDLKAVMPKGITLRYLKTERV
jgi:lysozyme